MGNWLGVLEGVVAGTVPTVGLLYTYLVNRRSQYDRLLAFIAESGMPPVSEDRHVAGMAFEPPSKHLPGQVVRLTEAEIKAVFNVLWYFERVDALYQSLRPALRPDSITRTQSLLLDSLGSSVSSWAPYLVLKWVDEAGHLVDVSDTTGSLRHLAAETRAPGIPPHSARGLTVHSLDGLQRCCWREEPRPHGARDLWHETRPWGVKRND
jgi:hypothetical protein